MHSSAGRAARCSVFQPATTRQQGQRADQQQGKSQPAPRVHRRSGSGFCDTSGRRCNRNAAAGQKRNPQTLPFSRMLC